MPETRQKRMSRPWKPELGRFGVSPGRCPGDRWHGDACGRQDAIGTTCVPVTGDWRLLVQQIVERATDVQAEDAGCAGWGTDP
jgi:hypothetical protein